MAASQAQRRGQSGDLEGEMGRILVRLRSGEKTIIAGTPEGRVAKTVLEGE